jgi:hypothetical protein
MKIIIERFISILRYTNTLMRPSDNVARTVPKTY